VAARTGRPVVLPDRAACLVLAPDNAHVFEVTGTEACVAFPLQAGARNLGGCDIGDAVRRRSH
jgi:hypothetical protein